MRVGRRREFVDTARRLLLGGWRDCRNNGASCATGGAGHLLPPCRADCVAAAADRSDSKLNWIELRWRRRPPRKLLSFREEFKFNCVAVGRPLSFSWRRLRVQLQLLRVPFAKRNEREMITSGCGGRQLLAQACRVRRPPAARVGRRRLAQLTSRLSLSLQLHSTLACCGRTEPQRAKPARNCLLSLSNSCVATSRPADTFQLRCATQLKSVSILQWHTSDVCAHTSTRAFAKMSQAAPAAAWTGARNRRNRWRGRSYRAAIELCQLLVEPTRN